MTKFIGVDLGTVKCGFSIGNDITKTARPLVTAYLKELEGFEQYIQKLSLVIVHRQIAPKDRSQHK